MMELIQSEEVKDLTAALVKVQAEMESAKKDAVNPHLKSKYADLTSVWEVARAPLTKNGFAVAQSTYVRENGLTVLMTTLLHTSGQWLRSVYPVKPQQDTPQGMGSALTYARRYSLSALVGVTSEDDDGHAASQPTKKSSQKAEVTVVSGNPFLNDEENSWSQANTPALNAVVEELGAKVVSSTPTQTYPRITEAQAKRLFAISKSNGVSSKVMKEHLKIYGYSSSSEITREHYDKIIGEIPLLPKDSAASPSA